MNEKITTGLGHLQMTLFMPVWARAVESKKRNSVLDDRMAVEITDSVDFDFSKMTSNLRTINQLSWIARSKRYDLVINDFVRKFPEGTVVNIGCGLDTTYERADLKPAMWYDLDLPDVISLRRKFIGELEGHKFISASFLSKDWLDIIGKAGNILFISAGVFVYFEEPVIKSFIIDIAGRFPGSEMLFDVTSAKGLQIANQVIKSSGLSSESYFKWALSDKSVFEQWDNRIKLVNVYYTFKLPGLRMKLKDRLTGFLSDSAGVQYMIHLKF
jgi:O-methyltransferase involved in polyketide biosynthesis